MWKSLSRRSNCVELIRQVQKMRVRNPDLMRYGALNGDFGFQPGFKERIIVFSNWIGIYRMDEALILSMPRECVSLLAGRVVFSSLGSRRAADTCERAVYQLFLPQDEGAYIRHEPTSDVWDHECVFNVACTYLPICYLLCLVCLISSCSRHWVLRKTNLVQI